MKSNGKFFWQMALIPKELQQHINDTLRKVRTEKLPVGMKETVQEFVKSSETVLSSSITERVYESDKVKTTKNKS